MDFHPISNIFPLMCESEISDLAQDINKNGLREPIVTFKNKILDGRNRFLACQQVKISPKFRDYKGNDPVSFVISLNLKRRQLTDSQKACVAVDMLPWLEKGAKKRQETGKSQDGQAGGRGKKKNLRAQMPQGLKGKSRDRAGKLLGIGGRIVSDAKMIKERSPGGFYEVKGGKKTVSEVKREIKKADANEKRQVAIEEGKNIKEETVFVRAIEELRLPDESVDLIITDPPYDDDHVKHYEMSAKLAEKCLKPGRFFCCYTGKLRLPEVINTIIPHLEYIWTVAVFHNYSKEKHLGAPYQFAENWRPVLIFKKPGKAAVCKFQQDVVRAEREKDFHDWQQDLKTPLQLIEAYTEPGELVLDPFCGGGTTLVAAKQLGRKWLGFDISEESVALSKKRLYGNN